MSKINLDGVTPQHIDQMKINVADKSNARQDTSGLLPVLTAKLNNAKSDELKAILSWTLDRVSELVLIQSDQATALQGDIDLYAAAGVFGSDGPPP